MGAQICSVSTCLSTLKLYATGTSASVGSSVLQALVDAPDLNTLTDVDFSFNENWFSGEEDPESESLNLGLLKQLICKQPKGKKFDHVMTTEASHKVWAPA